MGALALPRLGLGLRGTGGGAAKRVHVGGSLIFDGSTSFGSVATPNAWKLAGSRTIEFWVKIAANPSSTNVLWSVNSSLGPPNYAVALLTGPAGGGAFVDASGTFQGPLASGALLLNAWQHFACTWSVSGSNVTLTTYLGGAQSTTQTFAGVGTSASYSGTSYLGENGGSNLFAGRLSIGSLYSVALSPAEIGLRARGVDVRRGLVSRWQFTEGSGPSLGDSLGIGSFALSSTSWSADVPYVG